MGRLWLACATWALAAAPVQAHASAPAFEQAVLERVRRFVAARDFQGSVLIARHDSTLFEGTFAISGAAPSSASRYGIGSITKTFTAAAIGRLERRGMLRLDDPLSRFVPAFPHGDSITIEELLTHRAGIRDYYADPDYPELRTTPITLKNFAAWLAKKPLDFPPGTETRYSSSGYALLAYVVERASGRPYASYIRDELLEPLGMHDSGSLTVPGAVPKLAPGYDPGPLPVGTMSPVAFDWSWLAGSGSLYSTPRDLLRWAHAVLRDDFLGKPAGHYPYGWGVRERHHLRVIEQTGRIPAGYSAKVSYLPVPDLTVIVVANLQSEATGRLADDLETLVLGDTLPPMARREPASLAAIQADSLAGRYEMFPGFVLTVRARPDGVWLAGPDGDFMPLDAESRTRFFFRLLYVPVEFARDSTSRFNMLIWNSQFRAMRLP